LVPRASVASHERTRMRPNGRDNATPPSPGIVSKNVSTVNSMTPRVRLPTVATARANAKANARVSNGRKAAPTAIATDVTAPTATRLAVPPPPSRAFAIALLTGRSA
jgi:hypothetical protein